MRKDTSQYRVYYEDTDAGGVVYYANFLKFAERARTDMVRKSGIDHAILMEKYDMFYVVRKAEVEYLSPGRLDDLITATTEITKLGRTSIVMEQIFYNQHDVLLAKAIVQIVCVKNKDGVVKSVKFPDELVEFFG